MSTSFSLFSSSVSCPSVLPRPCGHDNKSRPSADEAQKAQCIIMRVADPAGRAGPSARTDGRCRANLSLNPHFWMAIQSRPESHSRAAGPPDTRMQSPWPSRWRARTLRRSRASIHVGFRCKASFLPSFLASFLPSLLPISFHAVKSS